MRALSVREGGEGPKAEKKEKESLSFVRRSFAMKPFRRQLFFSLELLFQQKSSIFPSDARPTARARTFLAPSRSSSGASASVSAFGHRCARSLRAYSGHRK